MGYGDKPSAVSIRSPHALHGPCGGDVDHDVVSEQKIEMEGLRMPRLIQHLTGGLAAIGLVAVGFGLGSNVAVAQSDEGVAPDATSDAGSIAAMVDACEENMDRMAAAMEEMGPMMDRMRGSSSKGSMGSMMGSPR